MTTYSVLGPHGYSRPPYGSFAGKPLFVPQRTYTQTFTVLGPQGYSRPPYGSFAGKTATTARVVGLVGGAGKTKRWFEQLQEEYAARDPWAKPSHAKKAVKARKEVEKLVDQAIDAGHVIEDQGAAAELAQLVAKTKAATQVAETLRYAQMVREHIRRLEDEDDEDVLLLLGVL